MNRLISLAAVTLFTFPALAADLESGPAKGAAAPELQVYDATGAHAGSEVDYAADRKGKPTVFLFVVAEKWDRPVAQFLRKLDGEMQKHTDAQVVAVWLTDEPETTKTYLPRAQQSLQFKATTLTCYPVAKKSPEPWGINTEAGVTAVVAREGKVAKSLAFRNATEGDVKVVMKELGATGTEKK